jgi:hypothetical protein
VPRLPLTCLDWFLERCELRVRFLFYYVIDHTAADAFPRFLVVCWFLNSGLGSKAIYESFWTNDSR